MLVKRDRFNISSTFNVNTTVVLEGVQFYYFIVQYIFKECKAWLRNITSLSIVSLQPVIKFTKGWPEEVSSQKERK